MENNQNNGQPVHKRRVRYSGTHPKKFEEKYKELNPEKYADTIEKVISKGSTPAGRCTYPLWLRKVLDIFGDKAGTAWIGRNSRIWRTY